MTTPSGQISIANVKLEVYGTSTGQQGLSDLNIRWLAGVSNTAAVSMSSLKSKTFSVPVWSPSGSTASDTDANQDGYAEVVFYTGASNRYATWTYSKTSGTTATVSLASGSVANTITFSLSSAPGDPQSCTYSVTGTVGKHTKNWTLTLSTDPPGGGTVTL